MIYLLIIFKCPGKGNLRHCRHCQLSAPHSDKYCGCSFQDVTQVYFQDFGLSQKSISRVVMSEQFFFRSLRDAVPRLKI